VSDKKVIFLTIRKNENIVSQLLIRIDKKMNNYDTNNYDDNKNNSNNNNNIIIMIIK
jgi:hypothetical protein